MYRMQRPIRVFGSPESSGQEHGETHLQGATRTGPGPTEPEQHCGRPGLGYTASQVSTPNRPKQVAGGGGVSPGAPRACFRVADTLSESPPRRCVLIAQSVLSQSLTRGPRRRRVLQEHAESLTRAPSRPRAPLSEAHSRLTQGAFRPLRSSDPENLNAAAQKRLTETACRGGSGGSRFLLIFHFRVPGRAGPHELGLKHHDERCSPRAPEGP